MGKSTFSKAYRQLTIADDYMFCNVLSNDEEICKGFLERILGYEIGGIVQLSDQKSIQVTPDGHGVRFDIYLKDDRDTIYDIEMQTSHYEEIPKRSRYYQAMIDQAALKSGGGYTELNESIIIFIVLKDIFGLGYTKYEFEARCSNDTELSLNDGAKRIILNAEKVLDDASPELRNLIQYISTGETSDAFTEKLDVCVDKARINSDWEVNYMTLQDKYRQISEDAKAEGFEEGHEEGFKIGRSEGLEEGRAEGHAEGCEKGRNAAFVDVILNMTQNLNYSIEDACAAVGITADEYNRLKATIV